MLPGATIGVLGGGQLGRMMAIAARRMGYRICVLDRDPRCPTGQFADDVVIGTLDDLDSARCVAERSAVVTLDTEHVPAEVLRAIAEVAPVRPGPAVLATIQDRAVQKAFLDRLGLAQARWSTFTDDASLEAAVARVGAPAIIKARRAGYDGKGQARFEAAADAVAAWHRIGKPAATVEELVRFAREISVVLARSTTGEIAIYPIAENVHRRHVLHTTRAPAIMAPGQQAAAERIATTIATALDHVGVMAVELFELPDGALYVNEIAPRTHNSGHYTYGSCATSQFEQHIRAVCGLPLGSPRQLTGAVMVNLIGDLWANGEPHWQHVLARPEARLHLYGKLHPARGRKMGHVLILDDDPDRALAGVDELLAQVAS
ncbi:MAG: 5-(carboxyamino)imidazole ribonucleotide synthase [Myxococcales bacterium]|nr:5-(carboxyamino)imidazole ribonucleotide synthase [Myxococcales bacterium]